MVFKQKDLLLKNDCKHSSLDKALFRWNNREGQLEGLILLHVDDFLLAGRTVLAIIAIEGWIIETIDIEAAFLQSCTIDRNVFIVPPPEATQDGIIWKLKKTVYGLDDASREWFLSKKIYF